ncbi:insulinase family protein [Shimwellia pseudoproteus]|uniref:M16 family metallopeptidase n=1 Tax=Shimwellia pseudoproteus TaxID=570012 RepID=UPI0018EBECDC|nr:pitrilysin family protein [Shimwellia pseudoproteus]MBJ3814269.1 insulinase family protein [Shimwellia pseudoproteus]
MQGKTIRLLTGALLMAAISGSVQAEPLQPDPAWQQGTLSNGFRWQVLSTPQRPSDRVQVRLTVDVGSLAETTQQSGYSRLLAGLALQRNVPGAASTSFWQQSVDPQHGISPVTVSYDFTQYNLSLPNGRNDLLKEAFDWLANTGNTLTISPQRVAHLSGADSNAVTTWPVNARDAWWRYRLKGSTLLGHDPAALPKQPIDAAQLAAFYHKWYTPDAMTLIVVGNVDSRSVAEQIAKVFGELKGKRDTPAPLPAISPLRREAVSLMSDHLTRDRVAIMWDNPWLPIRDSAALLRYWRADLAREALFWHIQQSLSKNNIRDMALGFDCRVLYQRAQCGINIDTPNDRLTTNFAAVVKELENVHQNGLEAEEFNALVAQKNLELQKLFAMYGRTSTEILTAQRLRSLQNQVVDIAPEQYQALRQDFLNKLTVADINQELHQVLSQQMAIILQQPEGEPEFDVKSLQGIWDGLIKPVTTSGPSDTVAPDDGAVESSDIPPEQ